MIDYIKNLNPEDPNLIYGQKYSLYRDGKYIGIATWTKDENVGDSFQAVNEKGVLTVYIPDRWEILN